LSLEEFEVNSNSTYDKHHSKLRRSAAKQTEKYGNSNYKKVRNILIQTLWKHEECHAVQ
jgi:hypothetical protein